MSVIREEVVDAAVDRAFDLIDYNIHQDIHQQYEFKKQTVLADKSLTEDEKIEALKILNKDYDRGKIRFNEGTKRTCENCNQGCLATLYCEYCVRNYLKAKLSNWTSGNDDIDNLIQKCQIETLEPEGIVEWIPYNNLQNIKYLTKGGCSKIYTAERINGRYTEWDSKKQHLTRKNEGKAVLVVLKKLENVENANQSWLEEAKSHLTISNKWNNIVQCYGLTKDPSDENYMLVMDRLDIDLRNYLLQQNHGQLTWKERIQIAYNIIGSLDHIHFENAIHRDLHSGNILYWYGGYWTISDLGFCGPADKSSTSIYGNLPYIAPEVLAGKGYTIKSDIYSFGMLMWEISSGEPPFVNYEHDFDFVINIINGMRPKVILETPLEYKNLMMQCWDADPSKRPDSFTLVKKINEVNLHYQNMPNKLYQPKTDNDLKTNNTSKRLLTSKVHQFKDMPEPKNATEEEQEAFYRDSKIYEICIPDNAEEDFVEEDFNESDNQNKGNSENLSKVFNELQINQS